MQSHVAVTCFVRRSLMHTGRCSEQTHTFESFVIPLYQPVFMTSISTHIRILWVTVVTYPYLNLLAIRPSTAASRSASSNTMNGALPPSSMDTCTHRHARCIRRS